MIRNRVYLALGGNLGDRDSYLRQALAALEKIAEGPLTQSSVYETLPVGPGIQGSHLNMCVGMNCILTPMELLEFCKDTELRLGRLHREKWGPREIDIDILFYADQMIDHPRLRIPHPALHKRFFVLVPLSEIGPNLWIPAAKKTVSQLAEKLRPNIKPRSVVKTELGSLHAAA